MNNLTTDRAKRVGDAERDAYVEHLAGTVSTGHLKPDEFEERRDAALTAVTAGDLMKLIADLPAVPRPSQHLVVLDQGGHRTFSPVRWAAAMLGSLTLVGIPGPVMSDVFHGLDHAPLKGGLPILLIILGVVLFICSAIALAPGRTVHRDDLQAEGELEK